MFLQTFRNAVSQFVQGVKLAYSDDHRIGPNDAPALRELAKATHIPLLPALVDVFTRDYVAPVRHAISRNAGYATKVLDYQPGPGGGFNSDKLDVVLGRPEGSGDSAGSLHVVSLGQGGQITLELGRAVTHGLKVFENPFGADGVAANPSPTKVEVWLDKAMRWQELKGDAGLKPVYANSENRISVRSAKAGGDVFDFKASGIPEGEKIQKVRLTDRGNGSGGVVGAGTAGADIDAVYGY